MKLNFIYFFSYIYLFFNNLFLPFGFQYTFLLGPIWFFFIINKNYKRFLFMFFFASSMYFFFHFLNGINNYLYYLKSYIYLSFVLFFSVSVFHIVNNYKTNELISNLVKFNFILFIFSILIINSRYSEMMWTYNYYTGIPIKIYRLKMFTYEPSYYSLLIIPLFFYCFYKLLFFFSRKNLIELIMITLPLMFSFSFGVIATTILSFIIIFSYKILFFIKKKFFYLILCLFLFSFLIVITTENRVNDRFKSILNGTDTSGEGRLILSFKASYEIMKLKSLLFGVGYGQVKVLGKTIMRKIYFKDLSINIDPTLYNSVADTMATLGLSGVFIKFALIFYMFIKMRVRKNILRLTLFIFMFIYQFTGSFLTNTVEYVIWVLCFSENYLKEFELIKK